MPASFDLGVTEANWTRKKDAFYRKKKKKAIAAFAGALYDSRPAASLDYTVSVANETFNPGGGRSRFTGNQFIRRGGYHSTASQRPETRSKPETTPPKVEQYTPSYEAGPSEVNKKRQTEPSDDAIKRQIVQYVPSPNTDKGKAPMPEEEDAPMSNDAAMEHQTRQLANQRHTLESIDAQFNAAVKQLRLVYSDKQKLLLAGKTNAQVVEHLRKQMSDLKESRKRDIEILNLQRMKEQIEVLQIYARNPRTPLTEELKQRARNIANILTTKRDYYTHFNTETEDWSAAVEDLIHDARALEVSDMQLTAVEPGIRNVSSQFAALPASNNSSVVRFGMSLAQMGNAIHNNALRIWNREGFSLDWRSLTTDSIVLKGDGSVRIATDELQDGSAKRPAIAQAAYNSQIVPYAQGGGGLLTLTQHPHQDTQPADSSQIVPYTPGQGIEAGGTAPLAALPFYPGQGIEAGGTGPLALPAPPDRLSTEELQSIASAAEQSVGAERKERVTTRSKTKHRQQPPYPVTGVLTRSQAKKLAAQQKKKKG